MDMENLSKESYLSQESRILQGPAEGSCIVPATMRSSSEDGLSTGLLTGSVPENASVDGKLEERLALEEHPKDDTPEIVAEIKADFKVDASYCFRETEEVESSLKTHGVEEVDKVSVISEEDVDMPNAYKKKLINKVSSGEDSNGGEEQEENERQTRYKKRIIEREKEEAQKKREKKKAKKIESEKEKDKAQLIVTAEDIEGRKDVKKEEKERRKDTKEEAIAKDTREEVITKCCARTAEDGSSGSFRPKD